MPYNLESVKQDLVTACFSHFGHQDEENNKRSVRKL